VQPSFGDLVSRLDLVEKSQLAVVHKLDEFRDDTNVRLTAIEMSLVALLESNKLLAELIQSRLPPPGPQQQ
jgi:hypothetical protein